MRRKARDESLFILVGDIIRPNVHFFFVQLEHLYFPPGTPANDLFEYSVLKWEDMLYLIGVFPRRYADEAMHIAYKLGLRFADGVPTVLDHKGARQFPVNGKFMFTLETRGGGTMTFDPLVQQQVEAIEINAWLAAHGFPPLEESDQ